ncbi:MAG: SAF domain-containing protein, partial [Jatrophihabitantaceae bacterium]
MTDTSSRFDVEPSPPARRRLTPSWVDPRLIAGLALVLVSVLLGASVLSAADHRQSRWALNRDLAAGTVLTGGDVHPVRVQLGAADSRYLPASQAVIGQTLQASGKSGELLSRAQLGNPLPGVGV